jgi:hypothetical protein
MICTISQQIIEVWNTRFRIAADAPQTAAENCC